MKGKIFTAQEVRALIAGNKTQFREVIKFSKNKTTREFQEIALKKISEGFSEYNVCLCDFFKCPYLVKQKIFCKESFAEIELSCSKGYYTGRRTIYRDEEHEVKWKPAQHMKQEQSRLTLQITEIRVERLVDISEEGAIKEGFQATKEPFAKGNVVDLSTSAFGNFINHWNATHKKPEEKFEASPFCWVIDFEVVK